MLPVDGVEPHSAASRAGLRRGDTILSLEGQPAEDMLDLAAAGSSLLLRATVRRRGVDRQLVLRRNPDDGGWGMHVAGESARRCRNRCVFCFVDQQPPGVRPSLRHKDDDIRYSFLYGTYVTLDRHQTDYALARSLSPIHVSVHATDAELRGRMLGRPGPAPVVPGLRRLREAGIEAVGQIVVVPGWNDGEALEQTMRKLMRQRLVSRLGVVPVGLTRHRDGLPALRRPRREEAAQVLRQCRRASGMALAAGLGRWVWASDELYILAEEEIPSRATYEGCGLRENGIGMIASLLADPPSPAEAGTVVTGSLAAPVLRRLLAATGYSVLEVRNRALGSMVGVAGLLFGADVVDSVRRSVRGGDTGPFFLPAVMFNADGLTLDDMAIGEMAASADADLRVASALSQLP